MPPLELRSLRIKAEKELAQSCIELGISRLGNPGATLQLQLAPLCNCNCRRPDCRVNNMLSGIASVSFHKSNIAWACHQWWVLKKKASSSWNTDFSHLPGTAGSGSGGIGDYGENSGPVIAIHSLPATKTVPEVWPNVPVIAINRNPVFPRFIKIIEVLNFRK